MKQKAKQNIFLFLIFALLFTPSLVFELQDHELEAAMSKVVTLEQILEKRQNYINQSFTKSGERLVNILIVAGHDDESTGTEFQGLQEVILNRELAQNLFQYLSAEPGVNAVLVSDQNGYTSIFERYFDREKGKIEDFIEKSKKSFTREIKKEDIEFEDATSHNEATTSVAQKLYGINKWSSTEKFDLVIHIHFNDYRGRVWNKPGDESGFAVYTPGKFLDNYELSRSLADSIFDEIKKVRPVSSFEMEKDGVIENHALIALGANQTLNAGSVLIEYGYIYEDLFLEPERRAVSLDVLAYSTYVGIKKLLNENPKQKTFENIETTKNKTTINNLKWQYQKALQSKYPPTQSDLRDCPITGYFGACSLKAL